MDMSDIVCISEHQLYPVELTRLDEVSTSYCGFGRSSDSLKAENFGHVPGHCGTGILWRKELSSVIRPLKNVGTDRFCAVEVLANGRAPLYIVAVYMPQAGCLISDYETQVEKLEACIAQWQGQVLLIGDWNAHFGVEVGPRAWGTSTRNGKHVQRAMHRHALVPIDLSNLCSGPVHTFCNSQGHSSYIDHCILSASMAPSIKECRVLEDELANTSDHLTLHVIIQNIELDRSRLNMSNTGHIMWHKLTKQQLDQYTQLLEELASLVTYPAKAADWSKEDIEVVVNSVISITKQASRHLAPRHTRKHPRFKPYWNTLLSQLVHEKKDAWRRWVADGKPRGGSLSWMGYQEAKRTLRAEIRRAQFQKDLDYINQVEQYGDLDHRAFWALINRRYKPSRGSGLKPFVKNDGIVLTGEDDIREAWRAYFEDLYTPKQKLEYDDEINEELEQRFKAITDEQAAVRTDGDSLIQPLTVSEVSEACRQLRAGKAPGVDGVQPEHLKYAGQNLLRLLTDLYNAMIWHEWRPQVLKQGIIVTIPKGSKDSAIPDNNRGITLMPVLGKVMDSLLLKQADGWINSTLDELQGANRNGVSSLETAACLQEAIAHSVNRGSSVYVALLDIRKAFDTVWHAGMFMQLYDMGMDRKLWRILRNCYTNFNCAVRVGSKLSTWFEAKQGVHQGDVFSMRLHALHMNGLMAQLWHICDGIKIGPVACGHDDMAIVARSKSILQKKITVCTRHSSRWRYDYGPDKIVVIVFGRDWEPEVQIKLSGHNLRIVQSHSHLGVPLVNCGAAELEMVTERIKTAKRMYYMVEGTSGSAGFLTPLTLSRIYQSVCIPKLCYGAEVWTPSERSLHEMEKAHSQMGRRIQGLPATASDPVSHATLGWQTVGGIFDIAKLMWVLRLLTLPYISPYHQIAVRCFTTCRFMALNMQSKIIGPFEAAYAVCQKYGLTDYVHNMMDSGVLMSRASWKRMCVAAVSELRDRQWNMCRVMYPRLRFFNTAVSGVKCSIWWNVCRSAPHCTQHCKNVVRILTGENMLHSYRGRHLGARTVQSSACILCGIEEEETVCHLLMTCQALRYKRQALWAEVVQCAPEAMLASLESMTLQARTIFLINGLNSDYVMEWQLLYEKIALYISILYITRCNTIRDTNIRDIV